MFQQILLFEQVYIYDENTCFAIRCDLIEIWTHGVPRARTIRGLVGNVLVFQCARVEKGLRDGYSNSIGSIFGLIFGISEP